MKHKKGLGVWLNKELTRTAEMNKLKTQLSMTVISLYKTIHLTPVSLKSTLYYSLLVAELSYGVWGTTAIEDYDSLITL